MGTLIAITTKWGDCAAWKVSNIPLGSFIDGVCMGSRKPRPVCRKQRLLLTVVSDYKERA